MMLLSSSFVFQILFMSIAIPISVTLNIPISPEADTFINAISLSCDANFDQAELLFASIPQNSPHYSASLHSLGNIAALKGNLLMSGMYHNLAKRHDPHEQPPLALMYIEETPCNNIGDIFWTSSFSKKNMYETFFAKNVRDARGLLSIQHYENLTVVLKEEELSTLFDAHVGLAVQLEDSGLVEYSIKHFQRAAILQPNNMDLKVRNALMVPVLYDSMSHLETSRLQLEQKVFDLIKSIKEYNTTLKSLNHLSMPGTFYIAYQGYNDASLMKHIRDAYRLLYPRLERVYLSPEEGYTLSHDPAVNSTTKIRVGFASHYFRNHSVCKLLCGLIHNLSKEHFHVTIFSSVGRNNEDEWTDLVKERSDKFVHLPEGMLLRNRNMPFDETLDILVYPDIGMDPNTIMWASSRLAKIQVCFWGHPTTTGLDNMDYFVSSTLFEESNSQEQFTEQLIQMDSVSFYFLRPTTMNSSIEKKKFDLSTIGIPKDGFMILCPQTLPKFHPLFDEVLHKILDQNSKIYIVAIYNRDKYFWKNKLSSRFDSVSPHSKRLILIPTQDRANFNSLVQQSELLLDPFPFGGGVTSLEAFHACKAVVTLPSLQTVPKLTSGMIRVMNMTETLIGNTVEEFVEITISLLDNNHRKNVEKKVCERQHLLHSQHNVVEEWENLFHTLALGAQKSDFDTPYAPLTD